MNSYVVQMVLGGHLADETDAVEECDRYVPPGLPPQAEERACGELGHAMAALDTRGLTEEEARRRGPAERAKRDEGRTVLQSLVAFWSISISSRAPL